MHNRMQDNLQISNPSNHNAAYNHSPERVVLPLPPQAGHRRDEAVTATRAGEDTRFEMEIYARFMRHLRNVPNSRMEIKILSAIQFTSDMMSVGDALVAKTLADLGLRAPRRAFPVSFLDFADKALARTGWDAGSPPACVMKMRDHWDRIGEDRFAHVRGGQYAVYNENVYISA